MTVTMYRFGRSATLQDHECPQDGARIIRELERRVNGPGAKMLPPEMGMSALEIQELEMRRWRANFAPSKQRATSEAQNQQAAFHSYMEMQAGPRRCPVCGHDGSHSQCGDFGLGLYWPMW
jgi:hypothetical protein